MVGNGALSHKIDLLIFWEILYLEGHQNRTTGSRVTAILLNGWILPIGEASAGEGIQSTGLHNGYKGLQGASLKIIDTGIFYHKKHFLTKKMLAALNDVDV